MPVALWLLKNWKAVGLAVVVAAIAGYILILRATVLSLERKNATQEGNIQVLSRDLETAKAGIDNVNAAVKRYQKYVADSLAAVAGTQDRIAEQNRQLQAMLDNLVVQATTARRIVDAPRIPFFTEPQRSLLIGVDNGVYHFRMRRPGDPADGRPELPAVDPR